MRIRTISPLLIAFGIALAGCESPPSIPLPIAMDARIVDPGPDLGLDMMTVLDAELDAQPDQTVDVELPRLDQGIPDYVVEVSPDVVPTASQYVLVGGGDNTTVVWWRGGRLLMKRFEARIERTADAGVPGLEPIDPASVELISSETIQMGFLPPYDGSLMGIRSPNQADGHPGWAFLPDVTGGGWLAIDLNHPQSTPHILGLYGDLRLGARSVGDEDADQVLIFGQTDRDAHATTAFIVLGEGVSQVPHLGPGGRPLPEDISTSGSDWIFAYDDGICALVQATSDGPATELGSWPCASGPGARLIGRGPMASSIPGFYAVGQTNSALVAWNPLPGERIYPGNIIRPQGIMEPTDAGILPDASLADGGLSDEGLSDGGVTDSAVTMDSTPPDSSDAMAGDAGAENEPMAMIEIAETNLPVRWLNAVPDGQVAMLYDGPTYIFTAQGFRRLTDSPANRLGVISTTGGALFDIYWDTENGEPTAIRATIDATRTTPISNQIVCPGRVPDACDHIDRDCDGFTKGFMCCHFTFTLDDFTLNSSEPLEGPWFVESGDEGPVSALRYPQQVELHNLNGRDDSCLGCWPGATQLTGMAGAGALFVMSGSVSTSGDRPGTCSETCPTAEFLAGTEPPVPADAGVVDAGVARDAGVDAAPMDATVDAGSDGGQDGALTPGPAATRPALFWHVQPGRVMTTEAPCESVLHLEAYRDVEGTSIHVYCAERRYDYRYMQLLLSPEPTAVEYPFGPARWIGPPVKRREGGMDVTYLLAAVGDGYELSLMRITHAGMEVVDLPSAHQGMLVGDRQIPIRPSISDSMRPARIRDGKYVDVYITGRGWRQGPAKRWVRSVHFSAYDHMAITVAETLDPTADDFDEIRQAIEVYTHDLQVGGNHWGRRLPIRSTVILAHSFHGISVADVSERDNKRSLWMGLGRARSPVTLSGVGVRCRADSEL
jgi:hypothetical protein